MADLSASQIPALSSHAGYVLRMVSNAVSHRFARRLADQDVTVAEWTVLRSLHDRDAVAPSALAADMGLTRGAITKLAVRLTRKGLVERMPNSTDGRAHFLRLTSAGRRKVPELASLADQNDAEFFDALGAQETEVLRSLLTRLTEVHALTASPLD